MSFLVSIVHCQKVHTTGNNIFDRHTGSCYPHFADNTTALYSLLSLSDEQVESQEKLMVLSKFICKVPEIETTLPYLPDFMEFYQWLHKDLAGVLTPEKADKLSMKSLVKQMSKHYAGERGDKLMSLYQRVKGNVITCDLVVNKCYKISSKKCEQAHVGIEFSTN